MEVDWLKQLIRWNVQKDTCLTRRMRLRIHFKWHGSPSDHTQEIHTSHQENDSPKEHSKPSKDLRCEWCFQNVNQTLAWDLWMLVFSIWSNIKQNEIHSFEDPLKQNSGIKFWGFQLPVSSTSAPENSNDVCSLHDERCFDWKCLSWLVCHWCVSCHKMLKRYFLSAELCEVYLLDSFHTTLVHSSSESNPLFLPSLRYPHVLKNLELQQPDDAPQPCQLQHLERSQGSWLQ